MSEYQYYEFQAIDRPLTPEEQQEVASLSSRVEPHPWRAVFTYNWSDFPGSAEDVLAKYYDAMLYMANWGTRQLMFRFPGPALDLAHMQGYCQPLYVEDFVSFTAVGEYVILNIRFYEEDVGEWIEAEGQLGDLLALREDILRGDCRTLYLAWLKTLEVEDVLDTVLEPPVPAGLNELSPALEALVDLLDIDPTLLQVASEASPPHETTSEEWTRQALARLSAGERDDFLLRLAQGEPHLSAALNNRLHQLAGPARAGAERQPRRTVGELLGEADRRRERERQRRAEEAERKRIQALEALAGRAGQIWDEVQALIQQTKGPAYDEAVHHLLELRELAAYQGTQAAFEERLRQIREQYKRRSGLMWRLDQAGL
jgi:hypothetical protein